MRDECVKVVGGGGRRWQSALCLSSPEQRQRGRVKDTLRFFLIFLFLHYSEVQKKKLFSKKKVLAEVTGRVGPQALTEVLH